MNQRSNDVYAFVEGIPANNTGTRITVDRMIELIRKRAYDPSVRQAASRIVAGVDGRQTGRQIATIRKWMANNFRFLRDPRGVEMLHDPVVLLRQFKDHGYIQGDCDDAGILAGTLGRSIGLRGRVVTVSFDPTGKPFSHTWTDLSDALGRSWVQMDVTRSRNDLEKYVTAAKVYPV